MVLTQILMVAQAGLVVGLVATRQLLEQLAPVTHLAPLHRKEIMVALLELGQQAQVEVVVVQHPQEVMLALPALEAMEVLALHQV